MVTKALLIGLTVASFLYSYDNTDLFKFAHAMVEKVDRMLLVTALVAATTLFYYLLPDAVGVLVAATVAYVLLYLVQFTQWVRG